MIRLISDNPTPVPHDPTIVDDVKSVSDMLAYLANNAQNPLERAVVITQLADGRLDLFLVGGRTRPDPELLLMSEYLRSCALDGTTL